MATQVAALALLAAVLYHSRPVTPKNQETVAPNEREMYNIVLDPPIQTTMRDDRVGGPAQISQYLSRTHKTQAACHPGVRMIRGAI